MMRKQLSLSLYLSLSLLYRVSSNARRANDDKRRGKNTREDRVNIPRESLLSFCVSSKVKVTRLILWFFGLLDFSRKSITINSTKRAESLLFRFFLRLWVVSKGCRYLSDCFG